MYFCGTGTNIFSDFDILHQLHCIRKDSLRYSRVNTEKNKCSFMSWLLS
jgi:hypothetical protein